MFKHHMLLSLFGRPESDAGCRNSLLCLPESTQMFLSRHYPCVSVRSLAHGMQSDTVDEGHCYKGAGNIDLCLRSKTQLESVNLKVDPLHLNLSLSPSLSPP